MALKFLNDGYFAGKVGIGTESPDSTLTVKATVDSRLGGIGWKSNDGTNEWTIDAPNAGNFRIYKGATAIARFDSSGNFGIGTTSPGAKLTVSENATGLVSSITNSNSGGSGVQITAANGTNNSLQIRNYAGGELMRVQGNGNVGIGTTSPSAKLEVNGALFVGNHTGTVTPTSGIWIEQASGVDTQIQMYTYGGSVFSIKGSSTKANIGWGSGQNRSVNFTNTGAGNISVGIGTDTPGYPLEVQSGGVGTVLRAGTAFVSIDSTGTASAPSLIFNGDSNTGIWRPATDTLGFSTAGSERMRITSAGNVGINDTSGYGKLAIKTGGTFTFDSNDNDFSGVNILMKTTNAVLNAVGSGMVWLKGNNNNRKVAAITNYTYGDVDQSGLNFYVQPNAGGSVGVLNEAMRITNTGGISFGTTGTAYGTSGQILKSNGNASPTWIDGSAIPGVPAGSGTLNTVAMWTPDGDTLGDSPITISGNNATFAGDVTTGPNITATGNTGNSTLTLQANTGNWTFTNVQASRDLQISDSDGTGTVMTINTSGNVGIGTTSPDLKLDVTHATSGEYVATFQNTAANLELKLGVTSTNYLNIQGQEIGNSNAYNMSLQADGGNVGINTTIPTQKLHVSGNARVTGAYYDSNNSPGTSGQVLSSTATGTDWIDGSAIPGVPAGSGAAGQVTVWSGTDVITGYTRFKVYDAGGQIQITDGTRDIRINSGYAGSTAMIGTSSSHDLGFMTGNSQRVTIDTSGNVGIGTSSPTAKLDVAGTGNFTGLVSGITPVNAANFVTKAYVDGSGGGTGPFLPLAGGTMTGTAGVLMPDNFKLKFGDATTPDLEIFHNGSNSYVRDSGTGGLVLEGSTMLELKARSGELYLRGNENSSVQLYHNNNLKLYTANTGVAVTGDINIDSALLSNQENTDVDTGTETVASVAIATYTAAFFDFVVKKGTNVRSGTVYACHDGTNVEFTETSTQDLGDTSDVTLSVDISGGNMRLLATVTSDDWSVKSLIRAI